MKIVILLATVILGLAAMRWADLEFLRVEPPTEPDPEIARPAWIWAIHYPYRRLQNAWVWVCVAATLGMGALLVVDRKTWIRPLSSGRIVGVVSSLMVAALIVQILMAAPPFFRANGICYGLRNALEYQVPGAIIGAWVVVRRKSSDFRAAHLVGAMWMLNIGLLVGYAPLFG